MRRLAITPVSQENVAKRGLRLYWTAWVPAIAVSGHSAPVMDITWDASCSYLLSTGSDQTTRVFAPWAGGDLSQFSKGLHHRIVVLSCSGLMVASSQHPGTRLG